MCSCIYPDAFEMLLVLIDSDANEKMQMQMVPYCWLRTQILDILRQQDIRICILIQQRQRKLH